MKTPCLLLVVSLLIFSCNHKPSDKANTSKSDLTAFAYPVKNPDHWMTDTGHTNIIAALKVLKAFEKNDTAEMAKYFTDTLMACFDGGTFTGPRRQYLSTVKSVRDSLKKVTVKLYDWQSVTSKDKKEAWVTTWTLRVSTNLKGKTDSLEYINDMQFNNSKIIKIDEYVRHLKKW
ncbi:MAG: hypothetical protein ACXVAU_07590 [Mucilaginibacter sp.]